MTSLLFYIVMLAIPKYFLGFMVEARDLVHYDYSNLKEIDWNQNDDDGDKGNNFHRNGKLNTQTTIEDHYHLADDFGDFDTENGDADADADGDDGVYNTNRVNQVNIFDWRERILRNALSKSLTNKALRQKFVEVMPILRVLSKQQRLALSALISAQINARKGHELKLEQVRLMFGDDKDLLIPIVYDIANLVRNSARKYLKYNYNIADLRDFEKLKTLEATQRRNFVLTADELAEEETKTYGVSVLPIEQETSKPNKVKESQTVDEDDTLEDFFDYGPVAVLDAKTINEQLESLDERRTLPNKTVNKTKETNGFHLTAEMFAKISNPLKINYELQTEAGPFRTHIQKLASPKTKTKSNTYLEISRTTSSPRQRRKRSIRRTEFVHKLLSSKQFTTNNDSVNTDLLLRSGRSHPLKLDTNPFTLPKENKTFLIPSTISHHHTNPNADRLTTVWANNASNSPNIYENNLEPYQQMEDIILATLENPNDLNNRTDDEQEDSIMFGINDENHQIVNVQINKQFNSTEDEMLPEPEKLVAGPRFRPHKPALVRLKSSASKRKRMQVRIKPKKPSIGNGVIPPPSNCERFTASMCIKTEDYPIDQIIGSIKRHRNAMVALLAEYNDNSNSNGMANGINNLDDNLSETNLDKKRREDDGSANWGGMCRSIVRYARPQKARSATGDWKYIVNTGQHTQTLRLEKCSNPHESCSYLSQSYRSHCTQIYNYHRLLSWDKVRGLHVDIFKVPTCCSCQIEGYRQRFPAYLDTNTEGISTAFKPNNFPDDLDYTMTEDDDDEFGLDVNKPYNYDANELLLSSKKVRNKVLVPTVGAYLTPPDSNDFEPNIAYAEKKRNALTASIIKPYYDDTAAKIYMREIPRRRPQKLFGTAKVDVDVDMDYSPSEQNAESEQTPLMAGAYETSAILLGSPTEMVAAPLWSSLEEAPQTYIIPDSSHSNIAKVVAEVEQELKPIRDSGPLPEPDQEQLEKDNFALIPIPSKIPYQQHQHRHQHQQQQQQMQAEYQLQYIHQLIAGIHTPESIMTPYYQATTPTIDNQLAYDYATDTRINTQQGSAILMQPRQQLIRYKHPLVQQQNHPTGRRPNPIHLNLRHQQRNGHHYTTL